MAKDEGKGKGQGKGKNGKNGTMRDKKKRAFTGLGGNGLGANGLGGTGQAGNGVGGVASDSGNNDATRKCRHWLKGGCRMGETCKFIPPPHRTKTT